MALNLRAAEALLCVLVLALATAAAEGATINVPAGGDLQQALTNAQPGDTVLVAPGATFTGNFTLPNKNGDQTITVRSAAADLPGNGARVVPVLADRLPKIVSPNSAPALQTTPGAHHWRLVLLEFLANANGV